MDYDIFDRCSRIGHGEMWKPEWELPHQIHGTFRERDASRFGRAPFARHSWVADLGCLVASLFSSRVNLQIKSQSCSSHEWLYVVILSDEASAADAMLRTHKNARPSHVGHGIDPGLMRNSFLRSAPATTKSPTPSCSRLEGSGVGVGVVHLPRHKIGVGTSS